MIICIIKNSLQSIINVTFVKNYFYRSCFVEINTFSSFKYANYLFLYIRLTYFSKFTKIFYNIINHSKKRVFIRRFFYSTLASQQLTHKLILYKFMMVKSIR